MSDFVSDTWHYYVAGLVILSLMFCIWVLISNMTKRVKGPVALHDHIWDEDLQEYNNPLPRWWMWLFWLTLAFGIAYFTLYPGLGRWQGKIGWSAVGQYKAEVAAEDAVIKPIYEKYMKQDLLAVAADPEAQVMGQRLFLTYCTQCHGSDARGAKGFPNLTDTDWLYGGEPATIKTTITGGRNGVMPPWGAVLGADGVKDVANYVRSLSGLAHDSLRAQRGKDAFMSNCVACHGPEGKGNAALGAPNLTDRVWLWGSSEATIIETVSKGRTNQMPAFKERLGDEKVHLLAAYVLSLSKSQAK
ncbi:MULTISPECIES: cytochrome-c oxidase, cbb3-type subunit III [unclassified Uliginosibacterium]|uniref:cytochrome-c oxidase, cbb3-type subunit III n=1 Tax=unclassified Uliginosibacterium TaxID=2621521 RepID=UPI000C7D4A34|nr:MULTISPECIES: cytochrome-c oxidase, cbb3-type subunit III [unclassified Uliginosibacterium]MDO6384709.1 cytochrome-c oxidase, cbb3-type subunit III [Uliginosibacterium sp. 31-12]PLK48406.1 cytochrome-c oxidase, cbb3-type subunit III [Uliginosibacterium sp. TH139]